MKRQQRGRRLLALTLSIIVVLCMMPAIAIAETSDNASEEMNQLLEGNAPSSFKDDAGSELKTGSETLIEGEESDTDLTEGEKSHVGSTEGEESHAGSTEGEEPHNDSPEGEESHAGSIEGGPEALPAADSSENNKEPESKSVGQDNPDHLSKPDDSSYAGKINYNSYPETPFLSAPLSRSSKSGTKANNPPIIGTDHPTEEGEVMLFKVATPVEGMVNTWDITLRIEGKDKPVTSDIILVIDTSGSMSGTRLAAAKSAANRFIDKLLPSTTTRIGIVNFDFYAHDTHALSNNASDLKTAINGLNANGGTFTQAGVKQAEAMLASADPPADNKHIVLLSDGVPTYSYGLTNPSNYLSSQYIDGRASGSSGSHWVNGYRSATTAEAPANAYTTSRVGAGNYMFHRYDDQPGTSDDKYYNHGNSAIAQAGFAWAKGINVYTVGLQTDQTGSSVLENMIRGTGTFTEVTDVDQLTPVFEAIAGQIGAAVKDAIVTDPMGGGFEVPLGEISKITVSQGEYTYVQTPSPKTINWEPGTLTTPLPDDSTIKYAELKYRVEINDDILNQTPVGNLYPTNGDAVITYTDANGNVQEDIAFPIPMVDPILLIVEKVLYDSHGTKVESDPYDRVFTIEIDGVLSGEGGLPPYHQIFNLRLGEKRIMTNLRLEDTYTVAETQVKYGGHSGTVGSLDDYTTTVNVYNIDQTSFKIKQDDPDSPVLVTNTEKALGEITVNKVFEPLLPGNAKALKNLLTMGAKAAPEFKFTLTRPNGTVESFNLVAGASTVLKNLPYGEYIVTETDSQGFVATYVDTDDTNGTFTDGKVTLTILEKVDSVTVTNRPAEDDQTIEVTGYKKWVNGPESDHVAVEMCLKRNGELMVPQPQPEPGYTVSPASGTAEMFTYTWTGLQKYDENGVPYKYTIDEKFIPNKYEKTVDDETLTVTNTYKPEIESRIEAKKLWVDGTTPRPTIYFELFRKIDSQVQNVV